MKNVNVEVVQCYAPTNNAEERKEDFYNRLQSVLDKQREKNMKILIGDFSTKMGSYKHVMGKHVLGVNEIGELLADFCAFNNMVIGFRIFPQFGTNKEDPSQQLVDRARERGIWKEAADDAAGRPGTNSVQSDQDWYYFWDTFGETNRMLGRRVRMGLPKLCDTTLI